jgi:hypothetical protein
MHRKAVPSLLAISFVVSAAAPAVAVPLKVGKTADGTGGNIEVTVPAGDIGGLKLTNGSVKMNEGKLSVRAVPDWLFDSHQVLDGRLIESRITTSGTTTTISGLTYFVGGDWLNNLNQFKSPDNLETTSGTILVGRVRLVNPDSVDFQTTSDGQTKRLSKTEIKSITSPRAFIFNIPASGVKLGGADGELTADATNISFQPTMSPRARGWFSAKRVVAKEPKAQLAGTEGGVTKWELAGMIGLDIFNTVSPAIVAPIVAPLGDKDALREIKNFNRQQNIMSLTGQ